VTKVKNVGKCRNFFLTLKLRTKKISSHGWTRPQFFLLLVVLTCRWYFRRSCVNRERVGRDGSGREPQAEERPVWGAGEPLPPIAASRDLVVVEMTFDCDCCVWAAAESPIRPVRPSRPRGVRVAASPRRPVRQRRGLWGKGNPLVNSIFFAFKF